MIHLSTILDFYLKLNTIKSGWFFVYIFHINQGIEVISSN